MFLNQAVTPLDLVNSRNYWKPLYPFEFSVIIVSVGLVFVCFLLLCTKHYQAKTVIFFVVEGYWDRAALHLFLDLVRIGNGLTAATHHLTGCAVEQNKVCV